MKLKAECQGELWLVTSDQDKFVRTAIASYHCKHVHVGATCQADPLLHACPVIEQRILPVHDSLTTRA